jgi:hypothetical protein
MSARRLFAALLVGLPACVVDTPVADRTRTAEQQLAEDLEDWCSDTCARVVTACQDAPCGCPPENADTPGTETPPGDCECEPLSVGDCALDCQEVMRGFGDHGEECARAGVESMRCIDDVKTCEELEVSTERCFRAPEQIAACNGGFVTCGDVSGGTGGTGSVQPPSGAAGRAASGPVDPAESGVAGSASALATCQVAADGCSDGSSYLVVCQGYTEILCDCFRNGVRETIFVLPFDACILPSYAVNEGCGWNVSAFD